MASQSLELFFIDGKPDGMLTAEVFGWTGHLLVTPRTRLNDALRRDQSAFTGIYILLSDQDDKPVAYIGEGENIANRIKSHDTKKDWWTRAVLITSAANNLHKAHVQYLESRLISEARAAGNADLENGNNPSQPSLSEAAKANMETFIDQILLVLPAIRVDLFTTKTRVPKELETKEAAITESPIFELIHKKAGIKATATIEGGEFVVQKGSKCRIEWVGDAGNNYVKLYKKLFDNGVIEAQGSCGIFTQNYAFSSTSAAGAVCNGYSTQGPIAWKVEGTKTTYKEWEAQTLKI